MAKPAAARRAALDILVACRRRDARARDLLRTSPVMEVLEPRDRALATRLVLGSVGACGTLDAAIDAHLRSASKLEPQVRDALRVSAFELMYLSTAPAVAVSQGVELVRSVVPRAAGMANAVLRRIAEEERVCLEEARGRLGEGGTDENDLALVAGLPAWLVSELVASMGAQNVVELALQATDPAPVFVAANTAKHSEAEAFDLLEEAGLEPASLPLPEAFILGAPANLARSGLVGGASVLPCDLSSQMVAHIAAPEPSQRLLEVGQGRGTKSVLLSCIARRLGGAVHIVATDVDATKVRISRERMAAAGLAGDVECLCLDARTLADATADAAYGTGFDTVFIDAPCSGVGTLRRHPEISWSLEPAQLEKTDPDSLPALQLALLKAASSRVKPGGALIYATCSPLVQEDEEVVRDFLASEAGCGFCLDCIEGAPGVAALDDAGRELILKGVCGAGCWRSTGALGSDYHFAARLIRKS